MLSLVKGSLCCHFFWEMAGHVSMRELNLALDNTNGFSVVPYRMGYVPGFKTGAGKQKEAHVILLEATRFSLSLSLLLFPLLQSRVIFEIHVIVTFCSSFSIISEKLWR